jgi:CHAT domain-containing protein/tetratricopeptide (TPR) repeat protein
VTRSPVATLWYTALLIVASVVLSGGQQSERAGQPDANALLEAGLFEQGEARARMDVDALRASYGDDSLQVATASDILVRALFLNGRAARDETLTLAKKTLRIKESHLGTESVELVPTLLNLCDVLIAAVDFKEAIAVARRAVSLSERNAGPGSIDAATALHHLGSALASARRDDDALRVLEQSVQLRERAIGGTDLDLARALEDLGLVLQRKGEYGRSGTALRRAEAIQEASDINHPAYVRTLNLIADQLWFEGQLLEARNASERAVALAERTLRPDHPTVALALRFLAATLAPLGDFGRSLELKKRALVIAERNYGPTHPLVAEYLHSVGLDELDQGDYLAARLHFQKALSIYTARYGEWHELVATGYSVMAETDARLGDYANARREQHRAVTIYSRVGGPNHPYVAIALTELATVYLDQGLPARALPLLERALAIREKSLGPDHRAVARTLVDLATTLMQMGRPFRAQQLATRALRIWERLDAPDAPEYATILSLYARLQWIRGDAAAAGDFYGRALTIRAKVFGPLHPLCAEAQSGLALAQAVIGDRDAALRTAASAEASGRDHLRLMLRSLPEREALNYAAIRPRGLDVILSLSDALPDAAPLALDGVIRSRALVLDEIAARQGAARGASQGKDPRAALTSAQQRLANLMVRGPGQMSPAQYQTVMEAARRESELAEQTLAEASADFRTERSRAQIGLDEVTAALPIDAALVSFTRYRRTVFDSASAPARALPSYVALVVRQHLQPVVVPLGSSQTIDTLVSHWRADISAEVLSPADAPPGGPVPSSRRSGNALRRRIWDRVAAQLGDATRVFIVPEGALSLVPFAALPVGRESYLLEAGPVIHYLSAERDLVPFPRPLPTRRGLLALGGPSFDDRTLFRARPKRTVPSNASNTSPIPVSANACGSLQAVSFQPLEGTLQEVRDLVGVWKANPTTESEDVRILVGHDAGEARFKQEAVDGRVLHLATHGFFMSGTCSEGPKGTRGIGGLATAGRTPSAANPLLLSGLALAGANRRAFASDDEDDGILTAEEVTSLNLDGVEWAVLSACDTGIGELKAGEGVFGLRRAFQVAGARTVIMSLWSVDDQATRAWMRALYEGRFQRRLSTADAVHAASLAVLRARRAKGQSTRPFYWAAFVAGGDWR